MNYWYRRRY